MDSCLYCYDVCYVIHCYVILDGYLDWYIKDYVTLHYSVMGHVVSCLHQ